MFVLIAVQASLQANTYVVSGNAQEKGKLQLLFDASHAFVVGATWLRGGFAFLRVPPANAPAMQFSLP